MYLLIMEPLDLYNQGKSCQLSYKLITSGCFFHGLTWPTSGLFLQHVPVAKSWSKFEVTQKRVQSLLIYVLSLIADCPIREEVFPTKRSTCTPSCAILHAPFPERKRLAAYMLIHVQPPCPHGPQLCRNNAVGRRLSASLPNDAQVFFPIRLLAPRASTARPDILRCYATRSGTLCLWWRGAVLSWRERVCVGL